MAVEADTGKGRDYRSQLPTCRDQGDRGTCLAFAVTCAHEFARGGSPELSEEGLFWACCGHYGWDVDGLSFEDALTVLNDDGQPRQDEFPYDPERVEGKSYDLAPWCPPPPWQRGQLVQIDASLDAIRDMLGEGQLVAVGVRVTTELFDVDGGVISEIPDGADDMGLHAMTAVGYSEADEIFLLRNSWGQDWGESGVAAISYSSLSRILIQAWTVRPLVAAQDS